MSFHIDILFKEKYFNRNKKMWNKNFKIKRKSKYCMYTHLYKEYTIDSA